jgi:hypothetical protein
MAEASSCEQKAINVMSDDPILQPGVVFDIHLSAPENRVQAYKHNINDNVTQDVASAGTLVSL